MNEPITIEIVRQLRAEDLDFLWYETERIADLAISQAETIKAQAEEIERLQKDCREYVSALQSQDVKLSKVKQERDEAYAYVERLMDNPSY